MSGVALDEPQKTLFDIRTKAISPYWIDPTQDLLIPINPLHFEAHKCQLLLARLEIQAERNPAQFNSTNYINTLEKFTKICQEINRKGDDAAILDEGTVVSSGNAGEAPGMGEANATSMGARVSADNPLAR